MLYLMKSMHRKSLLAFLLVTAGLISSNAFSQKNNSNKYPSLLWEITGNGLKKPSYLFGTMHVSSKMVFHLPDSFYYAIKNVETVALELNPDVWQGEMVRLDQLQLNYKNFTQSASNDFITEKSFQIEKYDDELKAALSSEPTVVNSLLYRTYKTKEDFEEDTFLDLYIFQTGKKLGKRTTGVENYYETEKIVLEAYSDMAKEKDKKQIDTDGESMSDIGQKMQDAYRNGDLDMLDSLENLMERSEAFRNKFLYKRNEIQANSIDTILKKNSLFAGVGAAHLAGNKGVIELLRKKGYRMRPVLMADRNAAQKDAIDKLKVPVIFKTNAIEDGFYEVDMPGPLFKMAQDNSGLDRRQYADMGNGTYYLVTRIKTYAAFLGQSQDKALKKVDSLLYENIPGKIISKTAINKNGYPGFDITNRTRRGDLQRYQVFATPFEVVIFKMSGKENYVQGKEAEFFFSSIKLRQPQNAWTKFEPKQGGFLIELPQQPHQFYNTSTIDGTDRWEYDAADKATGNAFLILKKSINNFRFLEEDTFDLSLMEESFKSSDFIEKEIQRSFSKFKGYPCLDIKSALKDGGTVTAKFIIKGPHYYMLAARSNKAVTEFNNFFSSFDFAPFKYSQGKEFTDTFLHYSVTTPVIPDLEEQIRSLIEKMSNDGTDIFGAGSYWPKNKNELFKSDSTGEEISLSMQQYPKYYFVKDSASFWKEATDEYLSKTDMVLAKKEFFIPDKNTNGYQYILRDTNSSRQIKRFLFLRNNRMYRLAVLSDTLNAESNFIKQFFATFRLQDDSSKAGNIFTNNVDDFMADLFSKDSLTRAKARDNISNVYYSRNDVSKLYNAITRLKYGDKDYFESKSRLIAELGYIRDTTATLQVTQTLKKIYNNSADTSTFQNKIFIALAKHRSAQSYALLKELLLQDPPVFENQFEYTLFFRDIEDSLKLAKLLFPEILQLSTINDYRDDVNGLLVMLVDSNMITAKEYESYFSKIYFDAKIELKKQQAKDEKLMELENNNDDNGRISGSNNSADTKSNLDDYAILLLPFYDTKAGVKTFFEKLIASKDQLVRFKIAILLLRNKKYLADSILVNLSSSDEYRSRLYRALDRYKLADKFPVKFKTQIDIARSMLLSERNDKVDSVVFLKRQLITYRGTKGNVYFFKYRIKKDDDWKIGITGIQPENINEVTPEKKFGKMTDKKIRGDETLEDQLSLQLKKILITARKSGRNFYDGEGRNRYRNDDSND